MELFKPEAGDAHLRQPLQTIDPPANQVFRNCRIVKTDTGRVEMPPRRARVDPGARRTQGVKPLRR